MTAHRAGPRAAFAFLLFLPLLPGGAAAQTPEALARQVEIRRTAYGVPHIRAANLKAAAMGLAYVQAEDYGTRVVLGLVRARGEWGRHFGHDSIDGDFDARRAWLRATETYPLLDADTRAVYDGFAAGINRYVQTHAAALPAWVRPDFTGYDVAARDVEFAQTRRARAIMDRIQGIQRPRPLRIAPAMPAAPAVGSDSDEGSNAWALAPSRTKSHKAILLRNPHLSWDAGYYEAHVTVPGALDFYGDFRIGGPFGVVGGFNRDLGWATTNNAPDPDEVYAVDADPGRPDHYLLQGASLPLRRATVTVEYANGDAVATETRDYLSTSLGPVVGQLGGRIYVLKAALDGEYRGGEQFLRMMRAHSLEEWKNAMRMLARGASNFTYADRAGNIFYVWYGTVPVIPHAPGGDTLAVPAHAVDDAWTRIVPFDSLPQLRNPKGGYIQQENDPFHFTNLNAVLDSARFPANFPAPSLGLRSQHAIQLVGGKDRLSLEDVIRRKHDMGMLLADRVKADLVAAVRASGPSPEVARAIDMIERWDNTVAPESRGGVLFEEWWRRYATGAVINSSGAVTSRGGTLYREPWTPARPTETPRGLADPARAAAAFAAAVEGAAQRFGAWDVAWGDVHRVRVGSVDVPVGGCTGALGCFRVLQYRPDADGKLVATGGDGWILAVEFGDVPRAYSILAYGESPDAASPHHADQAAMFARGELKKVLFTETDVDAATIDRYHPGEEAPRKP